MHSQYTHADCPIDALRAEHMSALQTRDLVNSLIRKALTAYAATVLPLTPNILITLSLLSKRSSHYSFLTQLLTKQRDKPTKH